MKFGAELEFTAAVGQAGGGGKGNFYEYLQLLTSECGIVNWKIEQDGSCGNEIVSPILIGEPGVREMLQVCFCANKAANDLGLSRITGIDCGIHFHFDASELSHKEIRNVLIIMAMAETLFYAMNPPSRFGTNFAAPLNFNLFQCIRARDIVDLRDLWFRSYMGVDAHQDSYRHKNREYYPDFVNSEKKPQKYDWTRYHGLNFVALFKHGTIEFRYAHGSFDMDTVEMWYRLCEAIMVAATTKQTRTILKTNFPFTMNQVKLSGLPKLQRGLYGDIRKVLMFLFGIKKGGSESLIEPTVTMMQFIAHRLLKFNHNCMTKTNYKKIMSMGENDDPRQALALMLEKRMVFGLGNYLKHHPELPLE